jgi:hypothetical protein
MCAMNLKMAQRLTRSTFTGDRVKSGDRGLASPARQSLIPRSGSFIEACTVSSEGRAWLGKALLVSLRWRGDQVAAGTPFAGQTPVISGSGGVERARRSTIEASVGFIGAGVSRRHGRGSARRGACGVGRWACSGVLRARRTRGSVLLPLFNSSPRSQACEFWQKIRRRPPPST